VLKFRLEDIPREGREVESEQDATWLDDRMGGAETRPSVRFVGPIRVHLGLSRSGSVVLVNSRFRAEVEFRCDRCLDPFPGSLASEYRASLKPKPKIHSAEEIEVKGDDPETEFYEGEEVDLTSLVQDQVLLALPSKALCREDCRGLCQRCGQNRNRGTCQCVDQKIDPRLEPLKKFRV
jgi:uncharacterized protein